jgi:hypothetical protein
MTKIYGAMSYLCGSAAIAMLALGLMVGGGSQAWAVQEINALGEFPQPTNKCDGNSCIDCAFSMANNKCQGECNTTTNAQICKDCECWQFTPTKDNPDKKSQCYCTVGKPKEKEAEAEATVD